MTAVRARSLGWLAVLFAAGSAPSGAQETTAVSRAPAQVAVVGNDYAFVRFPATIPAGATLFSFDNRGNVRHEMSVVLLHAGVTMQQIVEKGPGAASSRAFADRPIGILIARPGEASGGQLFVELLSGRRYLVVCSLKDAPDAPQHAQLGMVTSFDVP